MRNFFSGSSFADRVEGVTVQTAFDAEIDTPDLLKAVEERVPQIRQAMASLRETLPLAPHSGVGQIGRFHRLPNHYRSITFALPGVDPSDTQSSPGVIVFKGTEPLIPDFATYLDWMLTARFRSSPLSLGLHFPMDMRLPPAAMWIEECLMEQYTSSRVQQEYLGRHHSLARLPVPLFVFRMTPEQNQRYAEQVRSRIPEEAFKKISHKLVDGLGVEVYYYPELPIRVADLFVGNARKIFKSALSPVRVEATVQQWIQLLSELLCLDYMPFVPWHHGMGGCVDPGNVCIDGGFCDLLTLVPFDGIPDDQLFRKSLHMSIKMLAESIASLAAVSFGTGVVSDPDAVALAEAYVTSHLHDHIRNGERKGYEINVRLIESIASPGLADIFDIFRRAPADRVAMPQFLGATDTAANPPEEAVRKVASGA
jgi:hypothetical protein